MREYPTPVMTVSALGERAEEITLTAFEERIGFKTVIKAFFRFIAQFTTPKPFHSFDWNEVPMERMELNK
ncbi:MAG TPA: hypothetical protein VGK06_11455 [Methanosarcina sp.]|jgi:chemotaxis response regulator CheB